MSCVLALLFFLPIFVLLLILCLGDCWCGLAYVSSHLRRMYSVLAHLFWSQPVVPIFI